MKNLVMKSAKLSLLAAAVAASNAAMAEAVKVYGKANVSLQQYEEKDATDTREDNFKLNSNASRLGVKGDAELSEGVSAIYQMEFEVSLDDGDKDNQTLKQRNAYVGVKTDFGKFIAGIHDSPTKMLGKPVDIFSDLQQGDIKNVVNGEERIKNAVMYRSPEMAGFTVDAMFAPGEEDETGDRNGAADYTSIAVKYQWEGLSVGLSMDDEINQDFTNNSELMRLVAAYKADSYGVSALFTTSEEIDSASNVEQEGQIITAYYKLGDWKLKALVGTSTKSEDNVKDIDTTQFTVGADYKLAKKTKVFTYLAQVEEEQDGDTLEEKSTFGVGLEHKF